MFPKLSIITINLNNAKGLQKTIESIFGQSFKDYEYIIIDGGSTDGSVELIRKCENKLVHWKSERDSGVYNAMNKGIGHANGEYVFFLNSGDTLRSSKTLSQFFEESNGEDIVYANILVDSGNESKTKSCPAVLTFDFFVRDTLPHQSTILKRKLFEKLGLYNENYKIISDWEFFMKAVCLNQATYKHIDFCASVFHNCGISTDPGNQETLNRERRSVLNQNYGFFMAEYQEAIEYKRALEETRARLNQYRESTKNVTNSLAYKFAIKIRDSPFYRPAKLLFHKTILGFSSLKKTLRRKKISLRSFKNRVTSLQAFYHFIFLKRVPIVINSFNRLSCLAELIAFLEKNGYKNIIILDNQSTYTPLLDYYKSTPYRVIYLKHNWGHMALWKSNVFDEFKNSFFVYTDPDVIPVEDCPRNFLRRFMNIMIKHAEYEKVGFGLKLDDIPDGYKYKRQVENWEKPYWKYPIEKDVFIASIDTTFSLYSPAYRGFESESGFYKALRTGGRYIARHLPWYSTEDTETQEDIFYRGSSNKSASWINLVDEIYK